MSRLEPIGSPEPAFLARLNPAQRAAVLHGGGEVAGPLLVIAGAGTGKTNTLVHRLAHLVLSGTDPRRILLMTFSRRAAAEMTRRAQRIAGEAMGPKAALLAEGLTWAGTFHAIGARLLRDHAGAIGLEPGFTIHDREDSADLMNLARHRLGLSATERRFPAKATCLAIYSRAVNGRAELGAVLRRHFPWCAEWQSALKELFAAYVAAKQQSAVLDYDDLLLYWAGMMQDPGLAAEIGGRFDHVLVDEYQDTNRLQAAILTALKPDGRGLTVVGDDAQSIYAFRAAEVRNILDFPDLFSPRAAIVALEQNYRSTPEILAGRQRGDRRGRRGLRQAAAERPAAGAAPGAGERARRGRPGRLRLPRDPRRPRGRDRAQGAGGAVPQRPPLRPARGRADPAQHPLREVRRAEVPRRRPRQGRAGLPAAGAEPGRPGRRVPACCSSSPASARPPPRRSSPPWPRRRNRRWRCRGRRCRRGRRATGPSSPPSMPGSATAWPGRPSSRRCGSGTSRICERRHDDAALRRADLVQLEAIAAGFADRERFLTDITLDPPGATGDQAGVPHRDEDYLILSTIHSAKGQEWKRVFVLNCVDGCIPSDLATGTSAEIDEERRLFYVAITRARDALHLMLPQRFYVHGQHRRGDRHVYAARTRFIPDRIADRFEAVAWPAGPSRQPGAGAAADQPPGVDLGARIRAMWD